MEQLAALRCVVGLSRGKGEGHGRSSICGNHMNLGGPAATRLSDGLWPVFFNAPVPSGCTLVLSRDRLELDTHYLFSLQMFEYPVKHTAQRFMVCRSCAIAKPRREPPPLAAMLSYIQDCIEHLQIGNAYISTLYW